MTSRTPTGCAARYNTLFNSVWLRRYDGSHLQHHLRAAAEAAQLRTKASRLGDQVAEAQTLIGKSFPHTHDVENARARRDAIEAKILAQTTSRADYEVTPLAA
jgi:hypothetical protein